MQFRSKMQRPAMQEKRQRALVFSAGSGLWHAHAPRYRNSASESARLGLPRGFGRAQNPRSIYASVWPYPAAGCTHGQSMTPLRIESPGRVAPGGFRAAAARVASPPLHSNAARRARLLSAYSRRVLLHSRTRLRPCTRGVCTQTHPCVRAYLSACTPTKLHVQTS